MKRCEARRALVPVLLVLLTLGCKTLPVEDSAPRVSEHLRGDARFQASQQLVLEGLDFDASGDAARARGRYELSLQADPGNPWAYLALARHQVDAGAPRSALAHLEQAVVLFESGGFGPDGFCPHCEGLRGAALSLEGEHTQARPLLDAAARAAPDVWGDHHLSAAELR